MQSSGGVTTADMAKQNPVFTLLSGPVGGTIAGTALSRSSGRRNLLCVDMGGTSFDLSLVIDGKANTTLETELEGLPLLMSIVDIETIGTGGGSIAWLQNGAMRVGPHSAGSIPGPACYGRGGTEPTVTDANLYLGRLGGASLLSGAMELDPEAAKRAIEGLAAEVGMDGRAFAEGILAISNAAMADAMRTITVSQGLDPREFTLVAFGGAGPMAAVFLAEELDIGEVLIPRFPGTFSAWGMLQTDLRHDFTLSFFRAADSVRAADLEEAFSAMETEGAASVQAEGIAPERITHQRTADMRYVSQEYSINVSVPGALNLDDLRDAFHETHKQRYGHSNPAAPVEFVNLRVASFGAVERFEDQGAAVGADQSPDVLAERKAVFNGEEHAVQVLSRESLPPGYEGTGPAILEEQSATTVVPPGWRITVDEQLNVILNRRPSA
jgi:N-methylhydantoinase A